MRYQVRKGADHCLWWVLNPSGFALYVGAFPSYKTLYGTLSIIPIFLLWVYLAWCIVLFAAEIVAAFPEWRRRPGAPGTRTGSRRRFHGPRACRLAAGGAIRAVRRIAATARRRTEGIVDRAPELFAGGRTGHREGKRRRAAAAR